MKFTQFQLNNHCKIKNRITFRIHVIFYTNHKSLITKIITDL